MGRFLINENRDADLRNFIGSSISGTTREVVSVRRFGAKGDGVADDTAALQAAISETDGKWLLWERGVYRITEALSATLSEMRWIGADAKIVMDSASDLDQAVNILLDPNGDHKLLGDGLELDAGGHCHLGWHFRQTNGTHDCRLELNRLVARNTEMRIGFGTASAGISIRGGYKDVELNHCEAHDILMRDGAGVVGVRGVTGILVAGYSATAGAYARRVTINDPTVTNVTSEDVDYQHDMDGIGCFANPAIDKTLGISKMVVNGGEFVNCWGRDTKSQMGRNVVDGHNSTKSTGPTAGIINPAVDFQVGQGSLEDASFSVDGVECIRLVRFGGDAANGPLSHRWNGGSVEVKNGGVVEEVATLDLPAVKGVGSVSSVSVDGTVSRFAGIRTNTFDESVLSLSGIVCDELDESLVRVVAKSGGLSPFRGRVIASDCHNLGDEVPTVIANISGNVAQSLLSQRNCIGFEEPPTSLLAGAQSFSGTYFESEIRFAVPLAGSGNSGSERLVSFTLANDAEIEMPPHGYGLNYLAEIVVGFNQTVFAVLSVGNTGIVEISKGSAVQIGTTSDPGSGSVRIWRKDATNQLVIKNATGSSRIFTTRLFG